MNRQDFIGPGGLPLEDAASLLGRVMNIGLRFKYRDHFLPPADSSTLDSVATEPLPLTGEDLSSLLARLDDEYLPLLPNFTSPGFAGFPDSGNSLAGVAGALLGELLNVNMINSEFCSRGATEMEMALIRWLRVLIGYPVSEAPPMNAESVGGIPTGGGTSANYAAALLARERAVPGSARLGLVGQEQPLHVLMPSGIGHYTVKASLSWSGIGSTAALYAPVRDYRYDLDRLDHMLANANRVGQRIIMAVVYAGDSRTMTIDRLAEVAETVRKHYPNAWLHCDGCHGTSLLFSEEHRHLVSGISEYDSVTLDPHKVLTVPYSSSFLLLKNPEDTGMLHTDSDLILRQARSMGALTPVTGSRPFQSLRTWMLLKTLGVHGIGRMIDERIRIAQRFAALVDRSRSLIRLNDVNINSVMFTLNPDGSPLPLGDAEIEASSQATEAAYQELLEQGDLYLHNFRIADSKNVLGRGNDHIHPVLRFMSGNPLITEEDLQRFIEHLERFSTNFKHDLIKGDG